MGKMDNKKLTSMLCGYFVLSPKETMLSSENKQIISTMVKQCEVNCAGIITIPIRILAINADKTTFSQLYDLFQRLWFNQGIETQDFLNFITGYFDISGRKALSKRQAQILLGEMQRIVTGLHPR